MFNQIKAVAVYCASSTQVGKAYVDDAAKLGELFAKHDVTLVYGGGAVGIRCGIPACAPVP